MNSNFSSIIPSRAIFSPALLFALCFLNGCSTFNHAWKNAAAKPLPPDAIDGRWEGTWKSDANGHNDKLRCLVTKVSEEQYLARFHAKYKRVLTFTFGYTAALVGKKTDGAFKFHGEANLGWYAGGVYTYEGE